MKGQTLHLEDLYSVKNNALITIPAFDISIHKTKLINTVFLLGSIGLILLGSYLFFDLQLHFEQFNNERLSSTFGFVFLLITGVLLLFKLSLFAYSLYLYSRYKPVESVTDEELPTCTVIVPAYNEGKQVWDTLLSLAKSDYPKDKLQILAVDDGSKDNTWYWMQQAKIKLGNRLSIHQQPKNKGKRHALYLGFNEGNGEIFVTVDSDSVVNPDTLRNLVSPFVTNKNCGAVAGNVQVLNNKMKILPKMLNVSFVMSFEFVRSAESMLGSVLCTPGALAAYKREAIFNCLPEWINQKFMGQPSDIGEDRAITNMILKQGLEVVFQKNAYVYTNVPETYKGLYKMFIRWGRSNVREDLEMSKYVFKNFREDSKTGTRLLFLNQFLTMLTTYPFLAFMLYFIATHPLLFLTSTLFSILIISSFAVLFYSRKYQFKDALWAYTYSILYTFGLFWIVPYSIATAGKRGWLTRELS